MGSNVVWFLETLGGSKRLTATKMATPTEENCTRLVHFYIYFIIATIYEERHVVEDVAEYITDALLPKITTRHHQQNSY